LEGYAIVGIRVEGVDHEFATMKGITEDVLEIIPQPETGSLQKESGS
jgi:DNA-directed RNA polymerase alpha subunit